MKALSIIGICIHAFSFFCIAAFMETDIDAAIGWGVISAFFGIGASIYYVTQSKKKPDIIQEMTKLKMALDSGAITQEIYDLKKMELAQ